ncbi:DUF927 domain-containing protein [Azospirillum sp. B2RO_4]|uniref:DUF927 domain-containing protein n=1 Tax=Azospirillum sp. B2RO_4 TaxID=3027796 RepID=UPI003DA9A7E4
MSILPIANADAQVAEVGAPFELRDDGVYLLDIDKHGQTTSVRISGPLVVIARSRSFNDTDWGRLVAITTPDGKRRELYVPDDVISGTPTALAGLLARNGLDVAPDAEYRRLLPNYLLSCNPGRFVRRTTQTGWCSTNTFIYGAQVIGESPERICVEGSDDSGFLTSGSLDGWKDEIALPSIGNSRLMFALSLAFTGPLLRLLQQENLGVHLRGRSSTGKTTAAAVAASVWGPGDTRFIRSWRATDNALEPLAASRCDSLLVLDEISQAAPRVVADAAYMLMNGQGKARMTRRAGAEPSLRWKVAVLSTGETSLSSMLTRGPQVVQAGQEVRLIDLPADAGAGAGIFDGVPDGETPSAFARRLAQSSVREYGTAGTAFIRALILDEGKGVHEARQQIDAFVDLHCDSDVDGQVRRVAHQFGIVGTAGELAIRFGVLPWSEGSATDAAGRCFSDWMSERASTKAHEASAGIERVRDFILRHGMTRFTSLNDPEERPASNRVGFRERARGNDTDYYIFPSAFRDDICAPLHFRDVLRELETQGYLVKARNGSPSVSKRLPGYSNAIKVYHLRGSVVGDGEQDDTEE